MLSEYTAEIENNMQSLYVSLSEKDRRRYAAIEAQKLGHGGIAYISLLFSCDAKTIKKGLNELASTESMKQERIRRLGGGRLSALDIHADIDKVFLDVLREHTAGDPMDEKVKWSNLIRSEIRAHMKKSGITISVNIVKKLLKKHGYVKRKALKKKQRVKIKIEINNSK